MRCTHAEKLIPLFAGDDLPAREADALRRHLESCANCRRLAGEFEESRDWMRSFAAPQFDNTVLDGMRDSVLRDIGRIENRGRWLQWIVPGWNLRFAFAASLALLLIGVLLGLMINRRQPPHDPQSNQARVKEGGDNQVELPPDKTPDDRAKNDKRIATGKPDRRRSERKAIKPGLNEPQQTEEQVVEPDLIAHNMDATEPATNQSDGHDLADTDPDANRNMLRIEIQTADPNIRIIWFAPMPGAAPATIPNTK
jgi:hypothetical protein